jgi:hypothetical protein
MEWDAQDTNRRLVVAAAITVHGNNAVLGILRCSKL